jgi:hypothetical protein
MRKSTKGSVEYLTDAKEALLEALSKQCGKESAAERGFEPFATLHDRPKPVGLGLGEEMLSLYQPLGGREVATVKGSSTQPTCPDGTRT